VYHEIGGDKFTYVFIDIDVCVCVYVCIYVVRYVLYIWVENNR